MTPEIRTFWFFARSAWWNPLWVYRIWRARKALHFIVSIDPWDYWQPILSKREAKARLHRWQKDELSEEA
jgi:hypothetical protein